MPGYVVYRFFDEDGQLLYIGRTGFLSRRLDEHVTSFGYKQVATIKVEHCTSREDAIAREAAAIRAEQPPINIRLKGRVA